MIRRPINTHNTLLSSSIVTVLSIFKSDQEYPSHLITLK